MLKFKEFTNLPFEKYSELFLTEAKVSSKNVDKAIDVFVRLLSRKLSTSFYRFGGPTGAVTIKGGVGFLYFYNNTSAIRFNYRSGNIDSLTIWKRFSLSKPGDYTIDLEDVGLLQAGQKLINIVANPVPGKYEFFPEDTGLNESIEQLDEAKRISVEDFVKAFSNQYSNISQVSRKDILDFAETNGFSIPTVIWKKGKSSTRGMYDLSQLSDEKAGGYSDPSVITVKSSDSNTPAGILAPVGSEKDVVKMKKLQDQVLNPDPKKEMKDPDTLFGIMSDLVRLICRGSRNSLIILGSGGVGKTYVAQQVLKEEGLKEGKNLVTIKGRISTAALYQMFFMHRKDKVILLDDADGFLTDQDSANLIKAATDSYDKRTVSWATKATQNVSFMDPDERERYNEEIDDILMNSPEQRVKLPSEFIFDSRVIFISNLPLAKFPQPILSRSSKIDMTLTDEQLKKRMKSILPKMGNKSVPIDKKEEILELIWEQNAAGILNEITMRTYVAAESTYLSGLPNWQELIQYT